MLNIRNWVKSNNSKLISADFSTLELEMLSKIPERQRREYTRRSTGIDKLEEMFQEMDKEDEK